MRQLKADDAIEDFQSPIHVITSLFKDQNGKQAFNPQIEHRTPAPPLRFTFNQHHAAEPTAYGSIALFGQQRASLACTPP
ncbi:hypothetical protein [Paraburkholderia oxyphila]|uniref:hypothetical protein n=1 Tax=Paraburkholderia oxyphila TaxID=614212 RepID=UPI0012EE9B36|nr:hypothetical protein [Paraburkholderia oxyphila]